LLRRSLEYGDQARSKVLSSKRDLSLARYVGCSTGACLDPDRLIAVLGEVIWTGLHIQGSSAASQLKAIENKVTGDHRVKPHAVLVEIHIGMKATGLFNVFLIIAGWNDVQAIYILRCSFIGEKTKSINVSAAKS